MATRDDLQPLPPNLPVPVDDGAGDHLPGMRLPAVPLRSTAGRIVDLSALPGISVVYCYPRTGRPGQAPLHGWDEIPGARGCTPQSCAFRDHHGELDALGARVFGASTQGSEDQREAAQRLRLPFELVSDEDLRFAQALRLPTFNLAGMTFIKRLTLIIADGRIEKVFYPIFPPEKNAADVIAWLSRRPGR